MKSFNLMAILLVVALCFELPIYSRDSLSSEVKLLFQEENFNPIDIAIADLQSIENILINQDKKTAVSILKSAKNELKFINEIDNAAAKRLGRKIVKAIALIKQGKDDRALNLINQTLAVLLSKK